jgi:predicted permease
MLSDLRFALRSLAKSRGFAFVAILTVALGLASATAIYSVANAVVFRPLPFRDENSLAWVWSTRPDRDRAFFSIPGFLELKRDAKTTTDLAAITPFGVNLTGLGEPERTQGWGVTPNLFALLGTQAHLGRLPQLSDDDPGAPAVAVFGYGYWQRRFGGDPQIVGRVVTLNGTPHTVVGVLPRDFIIPNWDNDIFIALNLANDPRRADRGTNFLRAIARLAPGATMGSAAAEFATLTERAVKQFSDTDATITAPRFVPLRDEVVGSYRASLLLLLGAAAALLLIMCANLAGLLAARALTRQRDAALCSALGASPARLLRTYLAEGFVIAFLGGAVGVFACWWGLDALLALAPADLPRADQVTIDWHVLVVAVGCTLLTGLGIGLAPALRLARTAPQEVLKSGSAAATSRTRARGILVGAQIALCVVLLIGTGLLFRSLHKLLATRPGFESANVLTAQVAVARADYPTAAKLVTFVTDYQRRLAALPGVKIASLTHVLPLTGINTRSEFTRGDRPPAKPTDQLSAANRFVLEDFFTTTGIPLLAGRDFRASDDATGRPVIIIDEALARRDWPGEDPIGKTIRIRDGMMSEPRDLEIIGVAGPTKNFSLEEAGTPTFYLPFRQLQPGNISFVIGRLVFVAKTANDPLALKDSARRELHAIDANAAVSLRSFDEAIAWARAPRTFNLHLLAFFSTTAVLLAALGLYAITAQAVAARTRELGIRVALGADRAAILRLVLGSTARLAFFGIGGGVLLAAALTPLLARMLYGVAAFDPLTYGTVVAALTALTLLATWLPARRATKVDPITALRAE